MTDPISPDDQREAIREALRRDAARIQEPPFDVALHRTTMRRVRAQTDTATERWHLSWKPVLASAAAVAVVLAIFALHPPVLPEAPVRPAARVAQPGLDAAMASGHAAVASVSLRPARTIPSWMSPTASLLEPPGFPSASLLPH